MPKRIIDRATNFIIEDESWQLVEYDYSSVPGVIYLSLTEGKVNTKYDELEEDIADIDKRAKYTLALPETPQIFDTSMELQYTLMKNGKPMEKKHELEFISLNPDILDVKNGRFFALGTGTAHLVVKLKDYPLESVEGTIPIVVDSTADITHIMLYIDGNDAIPLGTEATYTVITETSMEQDFVNNQNNEIVTECPYIYALQPSGLATFSVDTNFNCVVRANDKNKLGTVTLTAEIGNEKCSKVIKIIPLW